MNIDDYENVSLGKPSPWPLGQFLRVEPHPTHRTARMAQVALVLLTLALLASLAAIIILYFQVEACTGSEKAQRKAYLDNITTLTSEMQMLRSHLENPRVQVLETKKTRSGLEDVTASSAVTEGLRGYLETITVLPVSTHQVQTRASGVTPGTPEGHVEEDLKLGRVTEPPGGPIKEALELGGIPETPGIHVEKVLASADILADVKMLKDLLETVNASYMAVRDEYRTILTLLSKGWKFYNGNLYYFSQKSTSWNEAEKFCVSWGSHLTSVASEEEQEFLIRRAKGMPYWIGLTSLGTQGSWHWVDGTPYKTDSRRFWMGGQPQPWNVRGKCVEMRVKALKSWKDRDCQAHLQGLCKKALERFEEDPDVSWRTELD
ncbi:C-type lectin domain family 4 member K-like [Trichosurus vulpecula]|uniref:C-type lectin domain family 4 member K-like n=1 Tax=Trichosurus vulpecula TaxID=9337 RepID=UPI00186AC8D2|nr:C-type lectin domain family 4 member K-like [Trichosurus vulpecula]